MACGCQGSGNSADLRVCNHTRAARILVVCTGAETLCAGSKGQSLGADASKLSAVSYGEEKPADPGHDEAAWAKNRRAEFTITQ